MYANEKAGAWSFERARVLIEEADLLLTDRVLFIILSATDDVRPRLNGCRRVAECNGYDNYVLARKHLNGVYWSMLDGWDNQRFTFKSEDEPFKDSCAGGEVGVCEPPLGVFHITFAGITVPPDVWAEALIVFQEEMH